MKKLTVLILLVCLFLPGCWDLTEPERLGLVMAVGIDRGPKDKIKISCAEINVRTIGGGMTGSGGGNDPPFHVHSGTGATVFDAIRRLSQQAPYRLFFAHAQVIIFSEELARERGIKPVIDFFERNEEMRRSTWLIIAKKGQMEKVINANMPIKTSKGQFLGGIIDYRNRNSFFAPSRIGDFIEMYSESGSEPYTAGVNLKPVYDGENPASFGTVEKPRSADTLIMDTAVFKQEKMVGWLNDRESRGLLWVKGEVGGGILTSHVEGKALSFEILRADSKVKPEIKEGKITMNIEIKVESNIGESEMNLDFSKTKVIEEVQKLQAAEVKKEILMALEKSRQLESDVFGFGRNIYAKYPEQWLQIKDHWYDYYPEIEIKIAVDSKVSRIGLISKPMQNDLTGVDR